MESCPALYIHARTAYVVSAVVVPVVSLYYSYFHLPPIQATEEKTRADPPAGESNASFSWLAEASQAHTVRRYYPT